MSLLLFGFLVATENGVDQASLLLLLDHHLFLALRCLQQQIRVFFIVALHFLLVLLRVHLFRDLLEFLHELFLEVLCASVVVHYLLLQIFELGGHELDNALVHWSFLAYILHVSHELFQVSSQQFQQVFLVPFVLSE